MRHWWPKGCAGLLFCLFLSLTVAACGDTTSQDCSAVINVNSCTSGGNSSTQATALAQKEANLQSTVLAQNATRTSLDMVVRAQATTQASLEATLTTLTDQQEKHGRVVSTMSVITPLTFLLSLFVVIAGVFLWPSLTSSSRGNHQSDVLAGLAMGAIVIDTLLLLVMAFILFFG